MLTLAQIKRLAQIDHIGAHVRERDYIQYLLLSLLYSRSRDHIFKGGTALRVAYRGPRYSEDLDFNGPADERRLRSTWGLVVRDLGALYGIPAEIRDEWGSATGHSFDVSYQGPLYDGRDRTKGKVRVDVNRRREKVDVRNELISPRYDDIQPFVLTVITPDHLLAEKVRALLTRSKPRDLYDIWLLLGQGVAPDRGLIRKKLAPQGIGLERAALEAALQAAAKDWERDLRPLLPRYVAWKDAQPKIKEFVSQVLSE